MSKTRVSESACLNFGFVLDLALHVLNLRQSLYQKIAIVFLVAGFLLVPFNRTFASFDPSYLISDFEFTDWASMTMAEIDTFLATRGSALTRYIDPGTRLRASQIIFDSAVIYQINPKVLLVLLQKEQSLIEDPHPYQDQYHWATGFAVCDSCSKSDPGIQQYKGFGTQVDRAAWRFRYYLTHPSEFSFRTGGTYPIDGTPVTMTNDATRALYIYTPHLHGNQNFVSLWERWFSKIYPDGSILENDQDRSLWLIQNGRKRKFASRAIAASRVNLSQVIRVSSLDLDRYVMGAPITYAQYSLLRSPRGTVYLLVDDIKRGFANKEAFRTVGFNPEEIEDVGWGVLNIIPEGPPITVQSAYPAGALIQDVTTGGVWYVQDGVKHALIARELLARFHGKTIQKAKPDQLAKFTTGDPIKLGDGTLLQLLDTDTVGVIANGELRQFDSKDTMQKLGYQQRNIIMVPEKVWDLHPQGPVINSPLTEQSN